MVNIIRRQPPRPYKLPEAVHTTGQFPQQPYASPEVLTAQKPPAEIDRQTRADIEKMQALRAEQTRILFPDAPPGKDLSEYSSNELANALDTLQPDRRERINYLAEQERKLLPSIQKALGVDTQAQDAATRIQDTIKQYTRGSIDLSGLIASKALTDQEIADTFNMSKQEVGEIRSQQALHAKAEQYVSGGKVNLAEVIRDGKMTDKEIAQAFGITSQDLGQLKQQVKEADAWEFTEYKYHEHATIDAIPAEGDIVQNHYRVAKVYKPGEDIEQPGGGAQAVADGVVAIAVTGKDDDPDDWAKTSHIYYTQIDGTWYETNAQGALKEPPRDVIRHKEPPQHLVDASKEFEQYETVEAALDGGMSPESVALLTGENVKALEAWHKISKYTDADGQVDISAALDAGVSPDTFALAGFKGNDIQRLADYKKFEGKIHHWIEDWETKERRPNIPKLLETGDISEAELRKWYGDGPIDDVKDFMAFDAKAESLDYDPAKLIAEFDEKTLRKYLPGETVDQALAQVAFQGKIHHWVQDSETGERYPNIPLILKSGDIPEAELRKWYGDEPIDEALAYNAFDTKAESLGYDTSKLLQAFDEKTLRKYLPGEEVDRALEWQAFEAKVKDYIDPSGNHDLDGMLQNKIISEAEARKWYDSEFVDAVIDYRAQTGMALDWLEKIGASQTVDGELIYDPMSGVQNIRYLDGSPYDPATEAGKMWKALEATFGEKEMDQYRRLMWATSVTMGPLSKEQEEHLANIAAMSEKEYEWLRFQTLTEAKKPVMTPPHMSDDEYRKLMRPAGISDEEWRKVARFVHVDPVSPVRVLDAVKADVPYETLNKMAGITKADYEDLKWQAEFDEASFIKQTTMGIGKAWEEDKGKLLGDLAIGAIPVVGTAYHWDDMGPVMRGVSIVGDVLFFIPAIKGVSAAVKSGESIFEAAMKGAAVSAWDGIRAPYTLARRPVKAIKTMFQPVEALLHPKALPLGITWRGSYSATMDITKVLAGSSTAEARATITAMGQVVKKAVEGQTNFNVPIKVGKKVIGELKYRGSGLQQIFDQFIGTSTPYGPNFKAGIQVREALFASPEHYLNLSFQSATGKAPLFVFRKGTNELLGVVDGTGKALNHNGKVIGKVAPGTKIRSIDGKKILGKLDADLRLVDKGEVLGIMKGGGITTTNPALIGKYYSGQPYVISNKVIGWFNDAGEVIDKAGKVIKPSKPIERMIGVLPEKVKLIGEGGVVMGTGKRQPAFALIKSKGVVELPDWVKQAGTPAEMEKRAWAAFKNGKHGGELHPVFKQYAKWIELEGAFPDGTRIIPLLDKKGKPVVYFTRDLAGNKIEIPVLQVVDKDWFSKSLQATRQIAHSKTPAPMKMSAALKKVQHLPAKSREPLLGYLQANREVKVIGSLSETIFTKGRIVAKDIDLAVPARIQKRVTQELADLFKKTSGEQIRVKGHTIERLRKGLWEKIADVDDVGFLHKKLAPLEKRGLKGFETINVDGVEVMKPSSQMSALLSRMQDNFGGKGYMRFVRYARELGTNVDLGIGAKPPSLAGVAYLKARGAYNTVRDIFVKGLTKETIKTIGDIAPDLGAQAKQLARLEEQMNAARRAYQAAHSSAIRAGSKLPTAAMTTANRKVQSLTQNYNNARRILAGKVMPRAAMVAAAAERMPRVDRKNYNRSITPLFQGRQPKVARPSREALPAASRAQVRPIKGDAGRVAAMAMTKPARARLTRAESERREPIRASLSRTATPRTGPPRITPPRVGSPRSTSPRETPPRARSPRAGTPYQPVPTTFRPPKTAPPKTPPAKPPERPAKGRPKDKKKKAAGMSKPGTMHWRQGLWWITLVPRGKGGYVKVYTKAPPAGAPFEKRTPEETFFVRGGRDNIPEQIKIDMGIQSVKISPTGEPNLGFKRKRR